MITIELPTLPPSVNMLYTTVNGRRVLSKAGRAWKDEATTIIKNVLQHAAWEPQPSEPIIIAAWLYSPRPFMFDLDNRMKALGDALGDALGVDDRYIVEWTIRKVVHTDRAFAVVTVQSVAKEGV